MAPPPLLGTSGKLEISPKYDNSLLAAAAAAPPPNGASDEYSAGPSGGANTAGGPPAAVPPADQGKRLSRGAGGTTGAVTGIPEKGAAGRGARGAAGGAAAGGRQSASQSLVPALADDADTGGGAGMASVVWHCGGGRARLREDEGDGDGDGGEGDGGESGGGHEPWAAVGGAGSAGQAHPPGHPSAPYPLKRSRQQASPQDSGLPSAVAAAAAAATEPEWGRYCHRPVRPTSIRDLLRRAGTEGGEGGEGGQRVQEALANVRAIAQATRLKLAC